MKYEATVLCLLASLLTTISVKASQFEPAPIYGKLTDTQKATSQPFVASIEPKYPGCETERKPSAEIVELYRIADWQKLPQKKSEYSRLVLEITADGKAVLNPSAEEAKKLTSPIELKSLTREKAKMLWGNPSGITYDLISYSRKEIDVYHLDLMFANGKLNRYRVRGMGISKPDYCSVE